MTGLANVVCPALLRTEGHVSHGITRATTEPAVVKLKSGDFIGCWIANTKKHGFCVEYWNDRWFNLWTDFAEVLFVGFCNKLVAAVHQRRRYVLVQLKSQKVNEVSISNTVNSLVRGHPRELKKVSVSGAVHL